MNRIIARTAMLCMGFAALVAGCRTAPLYSVVDAAVISSANQKASLGDVEKAIMRAGSALGWEMKATAPGMIAGTLRLRTHLAVVDIPYTAQTYSIRYRSSENLGYDGSSIHSNYNGWIQNLDKHIKAQLQLI
jgi:hypothetical protein